MVSDRAVPAGNRRLGLRMRHRDHRNVATLLIDGEPVGCVDMETLDGIVAEARR